MLEHLTLESKNVYGRILYYPVDSISKVLVHLTGRKTFIPEDIEVLKQSGFVVEVRAAI